MFMEEIIGAFTGENRRTRNRQVRTGTILGALGGLLVGAAVAYLTAPQSGAETREEIAKRAQSGYKTVKDYSVRAGKKIRSTAGDVTQAVRSFVGRGADVVEDAAREARDAARKARRKARAVADDAEESAEKAAEAVEKEAEDAKEEAKAE